MVKDGKKKEERFVVERTSSMQASCFVLMEIEFVKFPILFEEILKNGGGEGRGWA